MCSYARPHIVCASSGEQAAHVNVALGNGMSTGSTEWPRFNRGSGCDSSRQGAVELQQVHG